MAFIGNTNTTQGFIPAIDYFSGNGSSVAFTLSRPVASVYQFIVSIDNVIQNPSSAYSVSGTTLTFTSAPLAGTNNIWVEYTSPITQTIAPGQGTVTTSSLASSTGSGAVVLQTSPTITTPTISSLTSAAATNLTLQSAGTTAVTIDTSQNVGIGTTSPKNNSGYTTLTINNASNGGVLELTNNNTTIGQIYNDASNVYINSASTKNIQLVATGAAYVSTTTNGVERMRIDSSGVITSTLGGMQVISGTAQASTSGTSINFTDIPSWVKRITVMFSGVSTNGTSIPMVQLGAGSVDATSYTAMAGAINTANNTTRGTTNSTGFIISGSTTAAADAHSGFITFSLFGSNVWTCSGNVYTPNGPNLSSISGVKTLAGTLDRVRITTVNGTDAFDAGSINILYE